MPWERVVEHGVITAGIHMAAKARKLRFLKCKLIQPAADIRVSFAALLRICEGGRYVLVQNRHRPDTCGPFGGVYKYHLSAQRFLDKVEFKPEDLGKPEDTKNDLRGFLPRRNLLALRNWYDKGEDRESPTTCLSRELEEELTEIGMANVRVPNSLSFRKVRVVEEGPESVPGELYSQYRILEVYEPVKRDSKRTVFEEILAKAQTDSHLSFVGDEEIRRGRAKKDDRYIGHQTSYLLGSKRTRREDPPAVRP